MQTPSVTTTLRERLSPRQGFYREERWIEALRSLTMIERAKRVLLRDLSRAPQ